MKEEKYYRKLKRRIDRIHALKGREPSEFSVLVSPPPTLEPYDDGVPRGIRDPGSGGKVEEIEDISFDNDGIMKWTDAAGKDHHVKGKTVYEVIARIVENNC